MFDFIPAQSYSQIFFISLSFLVFPTYFYSATNHILNVDNPKIKQLTFLFLVVLIFYIGYRPIDGRLFGDTLTYYYMFEDFANSRPAYTTNDVLFNWFIKLCSKIMTFRTFLLICAAMYVIPLYSLCKKWFQDYWFYGFLVFISAFSFWSYGTNGVRNGIAASFFLLAISRDKWIWKLIWLFLALGFHKSLLVPTVGYILSMIYNKPKYFLVFWVLCIPLSLALGSFWENFFGTLNFEEDRLRYLEQGAEEKYGEGIEKTGFRWDFLIYSASAVALGCYYVFIRRFKDRQYYLLFNAYLFTNAFWILVIRANFTNRIAYLSWFMIALIVCYPLLKRVIIPKQHKKLGLLIVFYFLITFGLNVILS